MTRDFSEGQLGALPWQFAYHYADSSEFKVGDCVFLNSSPEIPLKVTAVEGETIHCRIPSMNNKAFNAPAGAVRHYKYASIKCAFKDRSIIVHLN